MNWSLRRFGVIVTTLVALTCRIVAAESQKARDLSVYDLSGPYSLDRSTRHAEDRPVIEASIREFLWTRWQRHRLAHLAVVQYSLEGLPTRTWYFIEPDGAGIWRLAVEEDVTLPAFKRDSEEHVRETHWYDAYSLDRVEVKGHNEASPRPISEKELRPPEEYRLQLKNKGGEVVRGL